MNLKYFSAIIIGLFLVSGALLLYTRHHNINAVASSVILQVPFTPQAPTDNWSRNEDCEETSITMANAFLSGTTENEVPSDEAQKAIDNLKIWEQANLGYNANTGSEATTKLAEGAFAMKVKQLKNFSEQDLKEALSDHHPILLPINARLLGNPKYFDNGLLYHMIVIRGYTEKGFIVNDPGTNEGNGNVYSFNVLKNAASDWDQVSKQMNPNQKIALVMSK